MSDVNYRVVTTYEGIDKQSSTVKGISGASQMLSTAAASAGSMMDSLGAKIAGVAKMAAAAAVGGGLYLMKEGVLSINRSLEDATNAMASSFNILGGTGFAGGLSRARELMQGIREDAASLPGEFQDFLNIAQTLTPQMTTLGKSVKDIRDVTQLTAIAAASVGVGYDQAGREMAQLLAGHAGAHNVLGMRLGINTSTQVGGKDFNKASDEERLRFLTEKLAKAKDALPAFESSFSGLASTMHDKFKLLLGEGTSPLFERLKQSMKGTIAILDSSEAHSFARMVGHDLVVGFDVIEDKARWIRSHWSTIRADGLAFIHGLEDAVHRVWPIVEKIGTHIAADPMGALKGAVGLRAGLGIVSKAPSIVSMFGGGGGALEGLGAGAGAAGGVAVVAALTGLVAIMDDVGGSARVASTALGTLHQAGSEFAPLIEKGGALRDAAGAIGSLVVQVASVQVDQIKAAADVLGWLNERWKDLKTGAAHAVSGSKNLQEERTSEIQMDSMLEKAASAAGIAVKGTISPLWGLYSAAKGITEALAGTHENLAQGGPLKLVIPNPGNKPEEHISFEKFIGKHIESVSEMQAKAWAKRDALKGMGGSGPTNITVNMSVLSEADPDRIAMKVAHSIGNELRARKSGSLRTFRVDG